MMEELLIKNTVQAQHDFFNKNRTRSIAFRKRMLKMLLDVMKNSEEELFDALYKDLAKSKAEAYMTEVALAEEEIRTQLSHIDSWSRPEKARPVLATFPSGGTVYKEPYGVMLIVVPWNYPVNLSFTPLAGAIAAGNTVVMKCSRNNEHTWRVIQKMINNTFPHDYIFCTDADSDYDAVIRQKYDYIFFTGSRAIGRIIMHAAADNLTPVSLELGGKSPCFVDKSANLKIAAKRIVWGKFLNAGQTCISIDYILADESIKPALIHELQSAIEERYSNAENSDTYPCIVNQKHYERLCGLIDCESNFIGGKRNPDLRKIAPTLIPDASFSSACMEDEIFGPVLPILTYQNLDDILKALKAMERPLACYIFAEDKKVSDKIVRELPFGGGCVNDTMMHISKNHLPFGGKGNSGMNVYHGKYSFDAFSHKKGVINSSTAIDPDLRYAPYDEKKFSILKKLI